MIINDNNPIGIISDIHAEHELLAQTIDYLRSRGVRDILCAGDIVDGAGSAESCIELLIREHVFTVRGNHDRWLIEGKRRQHNDATKIGNLSKASQDFLKNLLVLIEFETQAGRLLLCHGFGENGMTRFIPDEGFVHRFIEKNRYQYVINGHTHERIIKHFWGFTLINLGALQSDLNPGFAIVDFQKNHVVFFSIINQSKIVECEIIKLKTHINLPRRWLMNLWPFGW
jgi:predicted phosphodiesterase